MRFAHVFCVPRWQGAALSERVRKSLRNCCEAANFEIVLTVSLNAAPCYLGTQETCAYLIDRAQLLKSYRQGETVQIL